MISTAPVHEQLWQTDDDQHDQSDEGVEDIEMQVTMLQSPDRQEFFINAG